MKTIKYSILFFLLISSCKKAKFGGFKNTEFEGTWFLRATLHDKGQNGFDSTDINLHVPKSANIRLFLMDDGKLENWQVDTKLNSGIWALTEKLNKSDKFQGIFLKPNLYSDEQLTEIDTKTETKMILFYWTFDRFDNNGKEIYKRVGFIYEK